MSLKKKDAAAILGISTRQIENYARVGRITVRKERGKTGDISVYDEDEIKQLKSELDAKRGVIQAAVVREPAPDGEAEPNGNGHSPESSEAIRAFASQLSRLSPQEFIAQLADAILTQAEQRQQRQLEAGGGRAGTEPAEAEETPLRPRPADHQRACRKASFDASGSPTLHRLEQAATTRGHHVRQGE